LEPDPELLAARTIRVCSNNAGTAGPSQTGPGATPSNSPASPFTVRVDHDEIDIAPLGRPNEVNDLRMNCRLTARELDHFRLAFGSHKIVKHLLDFFEGQIETRACIRKT
jgi:hypothetical protein